MTMIRILIVVALQSAELAYMIVDRQAMLNAGRVVTLKVAPIDPRDIFRGDYVILSYDISRLEHAKLQGDDKFEYGQTVYVTLVRARCGTPPPSRRTSPSRCKAAYRCAAVCSHSKPATAILIILSKGVTVFT